MEESDRLAEQFEEHRPRLRAVAYRMLGSLAEADDAVQEAWLRLHRSDAERIENLGGWLTTVVARECLHALRTRRRRREVLVDTTVGPLPDPIISRADGSDPEHEVLLAESAGLALMVVLDSLSAAERLAFVLHDVFGLPFDEIASMAGRTPAATRQLASRARGRVRAADLPRPDRSRQRDVVEAFYAAVDDGDLARLVAVLDPDVVVHADLGPGRAPQLVRGAASVARGAWAARGADRVPVLVNGLPGVVNLRDGRVHSLYAFTVVGGRIVAIHGIRDAERVRRAAVHLLPDG